MPPVQRRLRRHKNIITQQTWCTWPICPCTCDWNTGQSAPECPFNLWPSTYCQQNFWFDPKSIWCRFFEFLFVVRRLGYDRWRPHRPPKLTELLYLLLALVLQLYYIQYLYLSHTIATCNWTTLCPKKVVHQTHGDTLSILNGFLKLFHCWKAR